MENEIQAGNAVTMGCPYRQSIQNIGQTFCDGRAVPELDADPETRAVIDRVLAGSRGKFHVLAGSNWESLLEDHIESGRVVVCDREALPGLFLEKKTFFLLDHDEMEKGFGREIRLLFQRCPPTLLTIRHFHALKEHYGYIMDAADAIRSAALRIEKEFVLLAITYEELVIADLLYVLVDPLAAVLKHGASRLRAETADQPLLGISDFADIKPEKYAILACNAFGIGHAPRRHYFSHRRYDYYFLHGEPQTRSSACLLHKPEILWSYPHAATGRFFPVFSAIMGYLGFSVFENNMILWYDRNYRNSGEDVFAPLELGFFGPKTTRYLSLERIVAIYDLLPPNSCLFVHDQLFAAAEALQQTGSRMIVLTRDMRDIVCSQANGIYGGFLIGYKKHPFADILLRGLSEDNFLEESTRRLVEIANHPDVIFIRFEDIHRDPWEAYRRLFAAMGLDDDPYYIPEAIGPLLTAAIHQASPELVDSRAVGDGKFGEHKVLRRAPAAWKELFTPRIKEYFKEHDNGILKTFGYERDDSW